MDTQQDRYFFLSGLISISLFLLLLLVVGYSFILTPKIEQFAMIKSDVINVSIAVSEEKPSEDIVPQPAAAVPEPVAQSNEATAESAESEPTPVPEISDLFSDIKPQKKAKEETKRQEQLNKIENDLMVRKETPRFTDKVSKVDLVKPSVKMMVQGGSTGPLVNEYHAKIQGIVYANFHPPTGTAGEVARVRMYITASGKLSSYKVSRYSANATFNSEVDWLKERLSSVRFPEHPEGKDTVLDFILTAKE